MSVDEIVKKIKDLKFMHWEQTISHVREFVINYATTNDMYLLAPPTMYLLEYATNMSREKVREMVDGLAEKLKDKVPETTKIFAKRVADNVFIIRIDPSEFRVRIINFFYSFDTIKKNVVNNEANLNVMLHAIVHKICFPEIYNFINEAEEQLNLFHTLANSYMIQLAKMKIKKKPKYIIRNKALSSWFRNHKDFICVNATDKDPFLKVVSLMSRDKLTNFIYRELTEYRKTHFISGDFDLTNGYIDIYKEKTHIARIFNGHGFCFPIDARTKMPTFLVLLKYALIDDIMLGYKSGVKYLLSHQKDYKFFDPKCIGELITPYRIYYLKNWGKTPWQYYKSIKYKIEKEENKN